MNSILSIIAWLLINVICLTSKIKKINYENFLKEKKLCKNIIYAFWHGRQMLLAFNNRFRNIYIMTSLSRDGELQTKILSKFGYILVRGSAGKRGAIESTLELIKILEYGHDIAMAVDGPTGPGFKVKLGALYLSQKTGKIIIPISSSAKHKKIFNNWDKYLLPCPFNRCVVVYGNPIKVNKDDNLEKKSIELEQELNRITQIADQQFF